MNHPTPSEFAYVVGKNAKDNWRILDEADHEDVWIHLQDVSSAYVIIKSLDGSPITKDAIHIGAKLCKERSKYKNEKRVHACYLQTQFVGKGRQTGQATLMKEPTVITVR